MNERLLKLVGPLHIVGGLILFATGFLPVAQTWVESLIPATDGFVWSPFFAAILGPTIASWGVLFAAIVNQYYRTSSTSLWWTMVAAIAIWAPLDTALCLYAGLYGGAIINTAVVVALAIMLLLAKNHESTGT